MSVTITATSALSQNGYTITDFPATGVEVIIDDCANTVNQLAQQTIEAMSGSPLTLTVTRNQAPAVKTLITIILRETKKTSLSNSNSTSGANSATKNMNFGPVGVSEGSSTSTAISASMALNNAADSPLVELFYKLIDNLKIGGVTGRSFVRA